MKFRCLLILLAMAFVTAVSGVAQAQDSIETIRGQYATINRQVPTYRKVKRDLSGYSAEGGELIAYFHGPTIMKLDATFFGETGKTAEQYYFWDGKLIFVFRSEQHYDKPLSGKVVSKKEDRYYFENEKLIRWIDENGKQVTDFQDAESEYLKNAKEFSEAARSKKQ